MLVNRADIAVAVTNDGKMLVAQGSGVDRALLKRNYDVAEYEMIYFSQLRWRSICKGADGWHICTKSQGIKGKTFKPTVKLRGGDVIEILPEETS